MSEALIRRALEAPLKTWADAQSPAVVVAWQNVTIEQVPVARYLRAFLLPLPTLSRNLERTNRSFAGVFQITVVERVGIGTGDAAALIATLAALYPLATPLTVSTLRVYITQPLSAAPGITTRDRYEIPCSLQYRADTY